MEPPRDGAVRSGGIAAFYCRARGDPTPQLSWRKNGRKVIEISAPYFARMLFILSSTKFLFYISNFVGSNCFLSTGSHSFLLVSGAPSAVCLRFLSHLALNYYNFAKIFLNKIVVHCWFNKVLVLHFQVIE